LQHRKTHHQKTLPLNSNIKKRTIATSKNAPSKTHHRNIEKRTPEIATSKTHSVAIAHDWRSL
jgi:hypothetical protein